MAIVLFDTNIIIDLLSGVPEAMAEVGDDYESRVISTITWMEVACGLPPEKVSEFRVMLLMSDIDVVQTTESIMIRAAAIRKASFVSGKKALPDCIIRATAEVDGRIVVTRNPKDFGGEGPLVRVPYNYDATTKVASNIRASIA